MKKAITAVVSVAVTRHVKAFDTLLALESTSLIESIQRLIIISQILTYDKANLVSRSKYARQSDGLSRLLFG